MRADKAPVVFKDKLLTITPCDSQVVDTSNSDSNSSTPGRVAFRFEALLDETLPGAFL